jgi:hypothetical protein
VKSMYNKYMSCVVNLASLMQRVVFVFVDLYSVLVRSLLDCHVVFGVFLHRMRGVR